MGCSSSKAEESSTIQIDLRRPGADEGGTEPCTPNVRAEHKLERLQEATATGAPSPVLKAAASPAATEPALERGLSFDTPGSPKLRPSGSDAGERRMSGQLILRPLSFVCGRCVYSRFDNLNLPTLYTTTNRNKLGAEDLGQLTSFMHEAIARTEPFLFLHDLRHINFSISRAHIQLLKTWVREHKPLMDENLKVCSAHSAARCSARRPNPDVSPPLAGDGHPRLVVCGTQLRQPAHSLLQTAAAHAALWRIRGGARIPREALPRFGAGAVAEIGSAHGNEAGRVRHSELRVQRRDADGDHPQRRSSSCAQQRLGEAPRRCSYRSHRGFGM